MEKHRTSAYNSVRVLQELTHKSIDRSIPTLFYLDAHGQNSLPLHDEVELAVAHFAKAILLIDDFAVPDDPGYGFNNYGPDKRLTLEYLLQGIYRYLPYIFRRRLRIKRPARDAGVSL